MVIPSVVLKSLFIIPLVLIGVATSYSDTKYGKIKNIHLFAALLYVLFLYSFLLFYSFFIIHQPGNSKYIFELLINGSISLMVGYFLWYFNLWAAGDAKLFTIYSLLVPLEYYSGNYLPIFPSAMLLINTFVLLLIFIASKALIIGFQRARQWLGNYKQSLLKIQNKTLLNSFKKNCLTLVKMLIFYLFISIALQITNSLLNKTTRDLISNPLLIFPIFLLAQKFLFKPFFKSKIVVIFIISLGILYMMNTTGIMAVINIIKFSVIYILLINIVLGLLNLYIESSETVEISIKNLKLGKCITQKESIKINQLLKSKGYKEHLSFMNSDGLTKDQIKLIQNILKDDPSIKLSFYNTFPFAPFMLTTTIIILFDNTFLLTVIDIVKNITSLLK